MTPRLNVLFLCTGNSCRSQMAEGWARHLRAKEIEASSAGVRPGTLDPAAVRVMAESGVDISGQRPKDVRQLAETTFDYVVTVCDRARESCPVFPARTRVVHAGFEDPPALAAGAGDEEEALEHYRRIRDEIRRFVETLPGALDQPGDRAAGREGAEIDAIYESLDRGRPEAALGLARESLRETPGDPVLHYLAGVALLEMQRPEDAAVQARKAVELDPHDAEFRTCLARCLYHACRFDEASVEARAALDADERLPDAHEVLGLLFEADGRFDEADRSLARAAELDPEGLPLPQRLSRAEFEHVVRRAGDRLPAEFRRHLAQVAVTAEPVPPREVLLAEEPPLDPALLGLFVGVALPDRSHFSVGGELPPRIYVFQRSLERHAETPAELEEQIAVTLYHELGHYLGLDESELAEIDLA